MGRIWWGFVRGGMVLACVWMGMGWTGTPAQGTQEAALWVEDPVRGLHVTSWVAGNPQALEPLLELVSRTPINALVIDIKEADGQIAYEADLPLARYIGATTRRIPDLRGLVARLHQHDIYAIARVVVFKDRWLAEHRPRLALRDRHTGGPWRDARGHPYTSPYSWEVRAYHLDLLEDLARIGFDEVQLDYFRLPSDGSLSRIHYPVDHSQERVTRVLVEFLQQARKRLHPYGTALAVDVFGITTTGTTGGIGQDFRALLPWVDVLSPMIYPSHYAPGFYGLAQPNAYPYQVVYRALSDALLRAQEVGLTPMQARLRIRPWFQAFTLGPPPYGPLEILAQIRAAEALGWDSWMLWNPLSRYMEAALHPVRVELVQNGLHLVESTPGGGTPSPRIED